MPSYDQIKDIFQKHRAVMSTAQLVAAKIYYLNVQKLLRDGIIEKIERGCYHWIDNENPSEVNIIIGRYPHLGSGKTQEQIQRSRHQS